uniref:Uncharacterized protein n=1 Tax=Micrurus spixii TaxID=129469 RepID=A0A2D4NCU6_9SAUR
MAQHYGNFFLDSESCLQSSCRLWLGGLKTIIPCALFPSISETGSFALGCIGLYYLIEGLMQFILHKAALTTAGELKLAEHTPAQVGMGIFWFINIAPVLCDLHWLLVSFYQ